MRRQSAGRTAAARRPCALFLSSRSGSGTAAVISPSAEGVVREWRGRGVGSQLLTALIRQARDGGLGALSLSVERDNYARRLERLGCETVGRVGGSLTMLLRL